MIKLILGDCVEQLKILLPNSVDLTVTSPPYDNLRTYKDSLEWNFDIFKQVADQLFRVTKQGGVVVWVVGDATIKGSETGTSFKQALYFKEIGFNLHDTMIYQKDSCPFPESTRYYPIFEYMFVLSKGRLKTFNPIKDRKNKWAGLKKKRTSEYNVEGSRVKTGNGKTYSMKAHGVRHNLWKMSTGYGKSSKSKLCHPAIFPEKLAHDHIISWSNEGDTVLDPFMGSGTTGKMSKQLNRKFIGIEKVEEYYDIADKRIGEVLL